MTVSYQLWTPDEVELVRNGIQRGLRIWEIQLLLPHYDNQRVTNQYTRLRNAGCVAKPDVICRRRRTYPADAPARQTASWPAGLRYDRVAAPRMDGEVTVWIPLRPRTVDRSLSGCAAAECAL